ncbi:MAG: hypothetical protein IKE65_04670 [Clostridia bacterium]|nr:hypothetical protein [Clostridia bacterium]
MKKAIKTIIAVVLSVQMALSLCACARFLNKETTQEAPATTAATAPTTAAQTTTEAPQEDKAPLLQYDFLSEEEQEVYIRLDEAIAENSAYLEEDLAQLGTKIVDRVYFYSLLADKPEYFFVRGNSTLYEQTDTGEKNARFDFKYLYSEEEYTRRLEQMQSIYETIKKELPKDADDFHKAKAVYDYLIEHCAYDYDYTGNSLKEGDTTASYADGALVDELAVCSGYSRAFKWMMDRFGIPCMCISNSDHEWNLVRIEDDYYHIDVTWADTADNSDNKYFCVSDEEIYKDHEKPKLKIPKCTVMYTMK